MCENVNNNPFAGLFSSVNEAVTYSSQSQPIIGGREEIEYSVRPCDKDGSHAERRQRIEHESEVDRLLKEVFGLTLRPCEKNGEPLVVVGADSIEHAVFERLLLVEPRTKLCPCKKGQTLDRESHTLQKQALRYLFESYHRLQKYRRRSESSDGVEEATRVILQNAGTALQEPDLFEGQQIHEQFVSLFSDELAGKSELSSFTGGVAQKLCSSEDEEANENDVDAVTAAFGPALDIVQKEAARSNLVFRQHWFTLLRTFASVEPLAKLVIKHSTPKSTQGRAYADTLIGALLNLSCLPKTIDDPFDFFDKPLQQQNTPMEGYIWSALDSLSEALERVFHLLLKCSTEVRELTLRWIGDCLHANANRGKLWNSHNQMGFGSVLCVSDGFMLNLGAALLRLCQPFTVKENDDRPPKIDPTYCAAETKDIESSSRRGVHLPGMSSETCLIPSSEDEPRPVATSFGFTTECFFLTHRALDLGHKIVLDKLLRTYQDVARMQRVYNDAETGGSSEVVEILRQSMDVEMTKYLSLRASLRAPSMLKCLAKFHATTAFWLVQVNVNDVNDVGQTDYAPREIKPVRFPLPENVPDTLRCIPEFVVENTIEFLCFLRRLNPNTFEEEGSSFLKPVLTEMIVLMSSQRRLYNPHLRARLAEGLEALLPTADETIGAIVHSLLGTCHRQELFDTHPHMDQIVGSLLQVFVSIEMTGQSVQFEQKFNYRRPMYAVMEYLWKLPEHRNNFVRLAEEAEANMEAVQPPLFLRFVNLLMNDAVFLLDEALSSMAQLRQMIQARENGEWNTLPQQERSQQAGYLQHIGMIARFDNILGRKTIETLKMLTTEIKSIFCHPTMVDRIASMLNYLLLQLVGPNKKNLKVNDQKEYAFNPANLVLNVCEIYINLSKSDSFTLAVSQDGRSYSPELFKLADNVLVRIGGVGILGDLDQFARSVEAAASEKRVEDEILVDAPEEFLDPIMSTLMIDPVVLPSSRISIDRQTIARHLLSDQTDPFNRSPLTMDMVKSDVELSRKIQEWIKERKEARAGTSRRETS